MMSSEWEMYVSQKFLTNYKGVNSSLPILEKKTAYL